MDLVDARAVVGRAICEHAIDRLDTGDLNAFLPAVQAFVDEAHSASPDPRRLQQLEYDLQHSLHRAGGNRALVLLHNSLGHVYERIAHLFEPLMARPVELADLYQTAARAVERNRRTVAKQAFAEVFELGTRSMHAAHSVRP